MRSEIVGAIKMRVYLSGMPELRLGLNDKVNLAQKYIASRTPRTLNFQLMSIMQYFEFKVLFETTGRGKSKSVELEDVKFHQCVRLSR